MLLKATEAKGRGRVARARLCLDGWNPHED
jgi:hypothetical protein